MIKKKQLIGLFGGTFDPIHLGHLALANHLLAKFKFEQIQFILAKCPPHRDPPIAHVNDRLAMLQLMTLEYKKFTINNIEIKRTGNSYTIDTLKVLKSQFKQKSLCFILATDAFNSFDQWKNSTAILNYCHLIVVPRFGHPLSHEKWMVKLLAKHQINNPRKLSIQDAGYIITVDIPESKISATKIRYLLAHGHYPTDMLTHSVLEYIKSHSLYR